MSFHSISNVQLVRRMCWHCLVFLWSLSRNDGLWFKVWRWCGVVLASCDHPSPSSDLNNQTQQSFHCRLWFIFVIITANFCCYVIVKVFTIFWHLISHKSQLLHRNNDVLSSHLLQAFSCYFRLENKIITHSTFWSRIFSEDSLLLIVCLIHFLPWQALKNEKVL